MQTYNIQVKPMRAYGSSVRQQTAAVFVDGYFQDLSFLSKDRKKLIDAFAQMICSDVFYLATLDEEIVGILACSSNQMRAMSIDQTILRQSFGYVKGSIAYHFMKDELNKQLPYDHDTGYIECVATTKKARGKGVSTTLFRYVLENAPYQHYVLEVVDTNENAYRLYKKLGFTEFERKKERFSKLKGFKERIYMELESSR
ncbi:GNAT family N-acetyltransferase [Halalkalibacterium halodurans]|uniref:BH0988 protein n=1 Tax=Halalkalibacterium halodurans (strain ATCC BAA-125 / DSM 18197 / FERM 7344 / JCM 9153 / C-125) TaxID=272558 RepID=Q9KE69_HALH5|nr:GNAT family N-acetyltransferase [Halalkalibacterium halodurans]MDY7221526.1 GNAT family N-acetyltransferase [Halalkalibacterium halodurans]MDY7240802.1 GNAT family N-acetyltransferase [Halalkalibacterium halodurans]MED4080457.1 GNAT family N-acetyltransferase [Halalkalibacterium halodurans]MED4086530.1 GNAT family N-acetyltransferase [Halalkalibacterium halodurans]MED4104761.1 GNAT family N-acetyltransferase [Halalkalibacterium halodurans]